MGTERLRVSEAITFLFFSVKSPSLRGEDNAENVDAGPTACATTFFALMSVAEAEEIMPDILGRLKG